jgi:long-chain acyl-CoA synthetase
VHRVNELRRFPLLLDPYAGEGILVTDMIYSGDRQVSRAELKRRAACAASGLLATGAREGGAIGVLMRNDVAFLEAVYAASFVGCYAVPINWHFTADEIDYILDDSGATHIVGHADLLHQLDGRLSAKVMPLSVPTPPSTRDAYGVTYELCLVPESSASWDHWLQCHVPLEMQPARSDGAMSYTSGTTGRPKGVRRQPPSAQAREAVGRLRHAWFGLRPGLRTAIIGPLYHSVQLSYALAALAADGDVFLTPRFDAEGVLRLIAEKRLTHLQLVPIMMSRLLRLPPETRRRYDVSSLEFVVHGAAPCPPDVKRRMIEWWGPVFHEHYGTTEAGLICRASSQEWLEREGTVGRPWPGRVVRIYDEAGNVLPAGIEGEVYASLGELPDFTYQNAETERRSLERDGLITNGDIGYLDADGYVFLRDRKRDMVISGGVNVYPAEVEAVLLGHPAVLDCAVFGVPDEEFGESVMAVVQPRTGARVAVEELRTLAASRLASFKVPRHFELSDALPRDESGKIFKRALRERHWRAAGRRI